MKTRVFFVIIILVIRMRKLKYIFKRITKMNFKKYFKVINDLHKKTGKLRIYLLIDTIPSIIVSILSSLIFKESTNSIGLKPDFLFSLIYLLNILSFVLSNITIKFSKFEI